jgi:hypothetical protein
MLDRANRAAAALACRHRRSQIGGSDAHSLTTVGAAWTEVPGAHNRDDFFAGLRVGNARPAGTSGNYFRLTRDIFSIGAAMVSETPWTVPVALLGVMVPVITLINYGKEADFVRQWSHRLSLHDRHSMQPPVVTEEVVA